MNTYFDLLLVSLNIFIKQYINIMRINEWIKG